ncbi:MAG: tRNA (guanosine(37)-N1)-methyltransferase TrmD [Phycisphaerales bacterium]
MTMRIDILTLFPGLFEPVLSESITGRARASGIVEWFITDIRRYADNKHSKVDDRPFGGGPGMVMMCQPLWDCVNDVEQQDDRETTRILFTPTGEPLTQPIVEDLAGKDRLLLIAGHYEGIDQRVVDRLAPREISVGDYVLSGGEIPALLLVDAVTRLLPGALGHGDSAAQDSFSAADEKGRPLLDCPHYTRPREWMGESVPDVLVSGNHENVSRWRLEKMKELTRARRPDLLGD